MTDPDLHTADRRRIHACDQTDTSSWSVIDGTGRSAHLTGQGTGVGTYFPGNGCEAEGIDDVLIGSVRG